MSHISPVASHENEDESVVTLLFRKNRDDKQEFYDLFHDGMALVERTANYLDGPGRRESKSLAPAAALAYATESMRLTTRLTQLATWLLARRAIINGDPVPQTSNAIDPLSIPPISGVRGSRNYNDLPAELRTLIEQAYHFHQKISAFNAPKPRRASGSGGNPVASQLQKIKSAFA